MALLLYREVIAPRMKPHTLTFRAFQAQNLWMDLYTQSGRRMGVLNSRTGREYRDGRAGGLWQIALRVELPVLGRTMNVFLRGHAWMAEEDGNADFDFSLQSGAQRMRLKGTVRERTLEAVLHTDDNKLPLRFPVPEGFIFSGGMGLSSFNVPLLDVGEEVYVDALDPVMMSMRKARVHCEAKEVLVLEEGRVETFRITTTVGTFTTIAWVTAQGEVIRVETPFGWVLKRTPPALVEESENLFQKPAANHELKKESK